MNLTHICSYSARWLAVVLILLAHAGAGAEENGKVLSAWNCPAHTASYERYLESRNQYYANEVRNARLEGLHFERPAEADQRVLDRTSYEEKNNYEGFECLRITYLSDGLKVAGYIWKPRDTAGKKLPLIIYNRGGNGDFSKLQPGTESGFREYLAQGFVVIGSQYRGNDRGEGRDEFGGADVRDVLNLIPLASSLGYIDMSKVFMLGLSRGGMMTYLALKQRIPVRAVAVIGGVSDLRTTRRGLEMAYQQFIPDYDGQGGSAIAQRSAIMWADRLDVPILLLHGEKDWRVEIRYAQDFAKRLAELGKTHELVIYANDDHPLTLNRSESRQRTIEWFQRFMH